MENSLSVLRTHLPEDDAVSMVLVRQEGTSTEDLLRQLQDDPRILSAEPNYVQRLDDPDQTALDESTPQVAAALGLDSSLLTPDNRSGYFRDKCTTAVTIIAPTINLAGAFFDAINDFLFRVNAMRVITVRYSRLAVSRRGRSNRRQL